MGLDLCLRAIADGHQVRWWRESKHPLGKGFPGLTVVGDWRASMAWVGKDGLVVMTGNAKFCRELDRFRDFGFNIFGPTAASANLEIVREAGMKAMQAVGIEIPHYETFNSLDEAEAFARKNDQAYVFKPLGHEDDKSLTYCSTSPADMVGWLQRQKARGMKPKGKVMLQEKIDMVAELGVSGWVGPEGFLPERFQICFEHKKLLCGDLGPNTGEEGTVCQYVSRDKLARDCLIPLEPIVKTLGHMGDFAVGVGIDNKGKAWPFEFTARQGWPAFFIQTASHRGDPIQWMYDLCKGKDTLRVDNRVAIGVVASQPPYPQWNGKPENVEGNPITGLEEVWDSVHPAMMMMGKGPVMKGGKVVDEQTYMTAGELVLVMTGLGSTVEKARKAVYGNLDEIGWSDKQWRIDIGEKLEKQLPKLHAMGYATEMHY
jgi:phosphoribosylamine--glycine ligase